MSDFIRLILLGDKALIAKLQNTAAVQRELTNAAHKSNALIHQTVTKYPRQRAGSTYRRTRRLGNSWEMRVEPFATGVRGFITNPTDYGGYVMGTEDQAWMHVGIWPTLRRVLSDKRAQIVRYWEIARDRIVGRFR